MEMADTRATAKLGLGARILQGVVFAGLVVMTCAAAWQTWKQVTLPDFSTTTTAPQQQQTAVVEIPSLNWGLLRQLDVKSGQAPDSLKQHDGKRVRIPGFVVPLEDNKNQVSEFLLVPYVGACIHTPPPPPNQVVQVKTADQKAVNVNVTDPFWIIGDLKIANAKNQYGETSYQLRAIAVEPYKEKQ